MWPWKAKKSTEPLSSEFVICSGLEPKAASLVASGKVARVKGTVPVSLPPNGQDIVVGAWCGCPLVN